MACSYVDEHGDTQYPPTCMTCTYTSNGNKTDRDVTWRMFYPNCPKINMLCNAKAGAYVSAVTVCSMHLF